MGAFTRLFSRLRITSDPNVSTQTSAVIVADTTNANLVIAPNGTGALIADIPDGTLTGGNARSTNAVDLQMIRTAEDQVARGNYSSIIGGGENTTVGIYSIAGGRGNFVTGTYAVGLGYQNNSTNSASVALGWQNTASGQFSNVTGGTSNTASSNYSTVSGGQSNTASTGTHATVIGGQGNTSSGDAATTGGLLNTASGGQSTAFGRSNTVSGTNGSFAAGQSNNVTGAFCSAIGSANTVGGNRGFAGGGSNVISGDYNGAIGFNNAVSGTAAFATGRENQSTDYSFVSGYKGVNIGYASRVLSNNAFSTLGSSQIREMIASRNALLTSAATTTLSLDGTGVTNLISTLYDANRMWHVTLKYVAVVTSITGTATGVTIGDIKTQTIELGMKRVITVSSLVGAGNFSTPQQDTSMNSASLIPTIVGNDLILTFTAPTFAGGGSVTCRVVAKVELVEVGY